MTPYKGQERIAQNDLDQSVDHGMSQKHPGVTMGCQHEGRNINASAFEPLTPHTLVRRDTRPWSSDNNCHRSYYTRPILVLQLVLFCRRIVAEMATSDEKQPVKVLLFGLGA